MSTITYTWKITGIKLKDVNDTKNAIIQTYWKKIGTDENGNTGEFSGATPFDTVDLDNFIPYEELTEEVVTEWVKSVVVGDYETHVNSRIEQQINSIISPVTETSEFPWGTPTSGSESTDPV